MPIGDHYWPLPEGMQYAVYAASASQVRFVLSVLIEYLVLRLLWRKERRRTIWRATFVVNLVSYVLITPFLRLAASVFVVRW